MVSQVFCVIYVYGSSWFFLVALVNSKFLYFPASSFVKTVSLSPQGTRTPNRWIESPSFSRLNWPGSNRRMSHCFVLLVWIVSQVFWSPILLRFFVILSGLHWSTRSFSFFLLHVLWKREVFPHNRLELLTVGLKVQLSPDWASGARSEACHLFPAGIFWMNVFLGF